MGYDLLRQYPALGGVAACGSLMLLTAILHPSWVVVVRSSVDNAPWQVTMGPIGLYMHEASLMDKIFPAFNSSRMSSETWGRFCAQGGHAVDTRFASICGTPLTVAQWLLVVAALLCFTAQVALWQSRGKIKCRELVGASVLFSALAVATVGVLRLWLNVVDDFAVALSSMASERVGQYLGGETAVDHVAAMCAKHGAKCLETTLSLYCLMGSSISFVVIAFAFVVAAVRNLHRRRDSRYLYEEIS